MALLKFKTKVAVELWNKSVDNPHKTGQPSNENLNLKHKQRSRPAKSKPIILDTGLYGPLSGKDASINSLIKNPRWNIPYATYNYATIRIRAVFLEFKS